ncbi:MAG: carboxypeptidase-like regulatory domain-containing protein, partial [Candidatus Atribacteria bacterium]|nr:carboxypeptidase-like regulatory domain-containing protein [Candidatus Atribacteria bacterium]
MVPEGSIKAKDLTGQALPDATINIIDPLTGAILATATTDANGNYQVLVPAGGPYLLQAVKDGVKIQQITPQVEVGKEYDLGTADYTTTAVALIVQAMLAAEDYPDDPADINLADIVADPNFAEVLNSVYGVLEAGGDPAVSAVVQQAVEDFLHPPAPISAPAPHPTVPAAAPVIAPEPAVITIAAIAGVTVPVKNATPVATITATDQYTGTVAWTPAHATFGGATVYTATITLTPKVGFTLTGVAANFFTVAGAAAT